MIITCVTCRYLPNLRYLARLCEVDRTIILDLSSLPHQYKDSFISRNRICNRFGDTLWLSVPIRRKGIRNIADAKIDNTQHNWIDKHIRSIAQAYPSHKIVAGDFLSHLENVLRRTDGGLVGLNLALLHLIIEFLQLENTNLIMQSSIVDEHSKDHRLDIAKALNATGYLAGRVERQIMENTSSVDMMRSSGINVFTSPVLDSKIFPINVVEKLSCVHAICTFGPEKTKNLIDDMASSLRDCVQNSAKARLT